jgi:feruloyl-CoA synthase
MDERHMKDIPISTLNFASPEIEVLYKKDGSKILRSPEKIGQYADNLGLVLRRQSETAGNRIFLGERNHAGGWTRLTYAEVASRSRAVSQALLNRGLKGNLGEVSSRILILSDNGIDNALLQLGAMQIGVISVPISPLYSLASKDHSKLKYIFDLISPALIYAKNGKLFENALSVLNLDGVRVVVSENPPESIQAELFADFVNTKPGPAVDDAMNRVWPETIAKILFTSGSTGMPKGVINTQRMLCSNQESMRQAWPFLRDRPPVVLDWLPWNHTFGGNHNFNMILVNGGTLYIDNGKATPELIERTVENLKEISPTIYFNVPRGYDMLVPYLEADKEARDGLFRNLDLLFYAAASLPQFLWERLEALSVLARGNRVIMASGWGSTETAPMASLVHFPVDRAGVIGLPPPGVELKFVPTDGKNEIRIRGPNVTPGYWKDPDLTRQAFDEEGFLCIGDAAKFVDPDDPTKGIMFDGRLSENFKLMSGTWVNVGELRWSIVEKCAPIVQDVVITGHDRNELGILIFPNLKGIQSLCKEHPDLCNLQALVEHPDVCSRLIEKLRMHNRNFPGNSTSICRAMFLTKPADCDALEINDKGYLNQRAVLSHRAELVEKLYAADPDDDVIIIVNKKTRNCDFDSSDRTK